MIKLKTTLDDIADTLEERGDTSLAFLVDAMYKQIYAKENEDQDKYIKEIIKDLNNIKIVSTLENDEYTAEIEGPIGQFIEDFGEE